MDFFNHLVLAGAVLLLLAILASALSYRIGMPLLLVFLAVGMLAGEDGPGGILFDDSGIAYTMGSVALAIILLDGGLNTRSDSFRAGLRPASVLATVGVLVTCVVTGLFAAWMLDFGWLEGLLVGAVVGSTDAAAVFALLHAKGLALKQRVSATLEIESGSNDPMAANAGRSKSPPPETHTARPVLWPHIWVKTRAMSSARVETNPAIVVKCGWVSPDRAMKVT